MIDFLHTNDQSPIAFEELGAKEKGVLRVEGRDYKMVEDVLHFRFNV